MTADMAAEPSLARRIYFTIMTRFDQIIIFNNNNWVCIVTEIQSHDEAVFSRGRIPMRPNRFLEVSLERTTKGSGISWENAAKSAIKLGGVWSLSLYIPQRYRLRGFDFPFVT